MRIASVVCETDDVKVVVSSRLDRALCLTSVKEFSLQQNQVSSGLLVMKNWRALASKFIVKNYHFLLNSLDNHLASFNFQIFQGNTERYFVVMHRLRPTIKARYIRVHPRTWYGHITLRMELYGCRLGRIPKCIHVYVVLTQWCWYMSSLGNVQFLIILLQMPSALRKRTNEAKGKSSSQRFSFCVLCSSVPKRFMSYILIGFFLIFNFV